MSLESPELLKKEKKRIEFFLIVAFSICAFFVVSSFLTFDRSEKPPKDSEVNKIKEKLVFGLKPSQYHFHTHTIQQNQFMGEILNLNEINFDQTLAFVKNTADIFNVRSFRAGKNLTFVRAEECAAPCYMFYELGKREYLKYTFCEDSDVQVETVERPFTKCESEAHGVITSSLSEAMESAGLSYQLISKMEDALASSVDFYHIQKGDEFKLIYEEIHIEDKDPLYGEVLGAYFKNSQGEHFAVYFENERYDGFYDLEGRPTKGAFLRAPVKFSRISSRYNRNRIHPIKKRRIPHLGTDYAASHGTPIISVANGVVTKVSFTRNNGKYVKIRHDKTYETQYLHMSGFAKGLKKGSRVTQGQVIGYVGATGLATGPHVCFRFWKNGQQINHLRENFPPADPLPESDMDSFNAKADIIKERLNSIEATPVLAE